MISLISLLKEVYGGAPKAIIMTGGAGVGKSTFLNAIEPHLTSDVKIFNPDTFNPEDDPNKPNITKNSKIIRTQAIPDAIKAHQSFIYDTTGQNYQETLNIVQAAQAEGYKVMIITLYASPIVSFLRNFSRDRKVEKSGVLNSWAQVYKNIEDFSKIPNIEYLLVQSPLSGEEANAVSAFERAFKGNELDEYFKEILAKDPDKFRSSFRKPESDVKSAEDLPDPEALKQQAEKKKQSEDRFKKAVDKIKEQFKEVEKYLKVLKPLNYKEAIGQVKNFVKP
jgi:deoxyadenosine/deoxycytidine kinase